MRPGVIFALIAASRGASVADDVGTTRSQEPAADDHASDGVLVEAAAGAGARGAAVYSAVELGLELAWSDVRLGLGARGVWEDGTFRRGDWDRPATAITMLRHLEVALGPLALAAGGLAPSEVAHLAAGYRVALDDRWHTGARSAVTTESLVVAAELDDAIDPALIATAVTVRPTAAWSVHAAIAIDPRAPTAMATTTRVASAVEVGGARRWRGPRAWADLGAALVVEPRRGSSGLAFAATALERGRVRFTGAAELRAGTGSVGSAWGPLYRIERARALDDRARAGELAGVAAGLALGASWPGGWVDVSLRQRPGLPTLATFGFGAPMGRRLQAGAWLAAGPRDGAGTAELRVEWTPRLYSVIEAARTYRFDAMAEPSAVWSAVAWFGATSH